MPNFVEIAQTAAEILIFRFFKMAAAASWDFRNLNFLTVGTVKRVKQHHRAKFRRNRLNGSRDMAIFRFFKGQNGQERGTAFIEIARTAAERWCFWILQNGGRRHL